MADDPILREKAREAICIGKLPAGRPDRITLIGTGSGATCAVCDEPVTPDQMELEIEVKRHKSTPSLEAYSFHAKCFQAWEFEREKVRGVST
jgi:hypothetical protein